MAAFDPMRVIVLAILVAAVGCDKGARGVDEAPPSTAARASTVQPPNPARRVTRTDHLARLAMTHDEVARHIGAHQCTVRSRLVREVEGGLERVVEQQVLVERDGDGRLRAQKHTDPHAGVDVVWTGEWLYLRLRHNPFVRRRPVDSEEPKRLANRVYGLLPAYIELLGPSMDVEPVGEGVVAGRPAVELRLALRGERDEAHSRPYSASRAWRATVRVRAIRGTAWVSKESGVPLRVALKGSWTFALPKGTPGVTGIPGELAPGERGRMRLELDQQLTAKKSLRIVAPDSAEVVTDVTRRRLEVERQMVVGERPLDPEWVVRGARR
jgi:hypothetical protein